MEHVGETFRSCRVRLDGQTYVECTFDDVVFEYAGGKVSLDRNTITNCRVDLDGDLARGIEFMRIWAHTEGPKGVKKLVDWITGVLRRPLPTETFTIE